MSDRTATAPGLYQFTIVGKGSDFQVAAAEVPVELLAVLGSGPTNVPPLPSTRRRPDSDLPDCRQAAQR